MRHVGNYNNNGQHKEITMHVWMISSRHQPMIIQSDPVNQKKNCSLCPSYSSSALASNSWRDKVVCTAYSLLLEYGLNRAVCHITRPLQHERAPWLHSLTERVLVGSHRCQGGTSHRSTQQMASHYCRIQNILRSLDTPRCCLGQEVQRPHSNQHQKVDSQLPP